MPLRKFLQILISKRMELVRINKIMKIVQETMISLNKVVVILLKVKLKSNLKLKIMKIYLNKIYSKDLLLQANNKKLLCCKRPTLSIELLQKIKF